MYNMSLTRKIHRGGMKTKVKKGKGHCTKGGKSMKTKGKKGKGHYTKGGMKTKSKKRGKKFMKGGTDNSNQSWNNVTPYLLWSITPRSNEEDLSSIIFQVSQLKGKK